MQASVHALYDCMGAVAVRRETAPAARKGSAKSPPRAVDARKHPQPPPSAGAGDPKLARIVEFLVQTSEGGDVPALLCQ